MRCPAPNRAKLRVGAENLDGALELLDECQSELGVGFFGVEECSVNQLAFSFLTDGEITSAHRERGR